MQASTDEDPSALPLTQVREQLVRMQHFASWHW